jgi:hypothetical protein
MFYVYMLRSISDPQQTYIGFTDDLRQRLLAHNQGESKHTAKHGEVSALGPDQLSGLFKPATSSGIRALSEIRVRKSFRAQTSLVTRFSLLGSTPA